MANEIANIFNREQLTQNREVINAFYEAFGYSVNANGTVSPIAGKTQRELPTLASNEVIIMPQQYHHVKFCNVAGTVKFFDIAQGSISPSLNNLPATVMQDGKVFVIAGFKMLQALEAVQVVGDDATTLDFGAMAANVIETSVVDITINKIKKLEVQKAQHLFRNADAVPNFCRLPKLEVVEPNSGFLVELTSPAAPSKWIEIVACGWLITSKP